MYRLKLLKWIFLSFILFVMLACNEQTSTFIENNITVDRNETNTGDNDFNNTENNITVDSNETITLIFIDSKVVNLNYECGSINSTTDSEGRIFCSELPIRFSKGRVEVGVLTKFPSDGIVTPQLLASIEKENTSNLVVRLISSFLQSLNLSTDITKSILLPNTIESNSELKLKEMTEKELKELLDKNGISMVSLDDAEKHLRESLGLESIEVNNRSNSSNEGSANTSLATLVNDLNLSDATIVYSSSPILNKELNMSVEGLESNDLAKLTWSIVSEPNGSKLIFNVMNNGQKINFIPKTKGEYTFQITNVKNEKRIEKFTIYEVLKFDKSKIEGNNGIQDIETLQGVVRNQYWVYSRSLSEQEIRNILINYPTINIIGWDFINGLLIESNDNQSLELLSFEKGITSIDKRVYTGSKIKKEFSSYSLPINYISKFDDAGDNWHLESIGIEKAWEYTTGNDKILIGLLDNGFYKHQDLENKYEALFTTKEENHGTEVTGTIVANPHITNGMLGINWHSRVVANSYDETALLDDCKFDNAILYSMVVNYFSIDKKMKLVNNSWGCMENHELWKGDTLGSRPVAK